MSSHHKIHPPIGDLAAVPDGGEGRLGRVGGAQVLPVLGVDRQLDKQARNQALSAQALTGPDLRWAILGSNQ